MIFKNKDILATEFSIKKIIDKTEIIKLLDQYFDSNLIYITGRTGTGKTHIITLYYQERVLPKNILYYIDCKTLSSKTFYGILSYLMEFFYKDKIIETKFMFWTQVVCEDELINYLKNNDVKIYVILDEVDKLKLTTFSDLIHWFQNIFDKSGHKIKLILISNDIYLDTKLDEATFRRLQAKIHFPSYNISEIYQILEEYAKLSLIEGSYTQEDILKVAKEVEGDVRSAKELLYHWAILCEEEGKLSDEKFEEALWMMEYNSIEKEVSKFTIDEKLLLLAIIDLNLFYEKEKAQLKTAKGFQRFIEDPKILPTYKRVKEKFEELVLTYGFKSYIGEKKFRRIIDKFKKLGFIEIDIKAFGRGKGVSGIVRLLKSPEKFKDIIDKSMI
ncbi:MAG: AAA family ATPase [Candidatus Bathyarchaeia archaeon]